MKTGIIIVDHGSRLSESNQLLEQVARAFGERFAKEFPIVEAAHMEISEPSIASAYGRCVERGAQRIVVCPYFLGPGKHWTKDIPNLTAAAQKQHPGTTYHVTGTLGLDDLMLELLWKRVQQCKTAEFSCPKCENSNRCGPEVRASLMDMP